MLPMMRSPKFRGRPVAERISQRFAGERRLALRRSVTLRRAAWLLSVAAVLLAAFVWAPEARAGGVVSTCDEVHLNSALAGGGSVTFSCSGTITLTSAITIAANTSIDGTGQTVAVSGGGAVQVFLVNSGVNFSVNNLTIENGHSIFDGGGISSNHGTLTVTNSTFSGNTVGRSGGGIVSFNGGVLVVTNSTFSGNSAGFGGGIYSDGTLIITNSTFSGNTASSGGGGIINSDGKVAVTNSTFSGNTAPPSFGGAIYNSGGSVKLQNTILANGTSGGDCSGPVTDGGYNLSDDASCAFSSSGSSNSVPTASLNLGVLASNGGPTQTIAPGAGSVAIDAIPAGNNGCGTTVAEDQRGITRPQNFKCDIGAYEVVPPPTTVVGIESGASCNEAALDSAVAKGGLVTFNCPAPTTITVTSRIAVSKNTAIDAAGQSITISGGGLVGVFSVNSGVSFSVNNLTIENGNSSFGGGISSLGGELIVTNSTFSGNSAGSVGGGIYSSGALIVTNSTLSGNSAVSGGGGIYNDSGGTLVVTNSTFSGNSTVNFGGAIEISGLSGAAVANVTNTTFWGNSAPSSSGGGIANFHGTLTVKNTIVANNGTGGNCLLSGGTATSGGDNFSDDTTCSFFTGTGDVNNTPAGLDPAGLKNNGGPTQTIALQSTSPAVDAIPVSACTDPGGIQVITDQRGVFRPQRTACDIGAYELTPLSVATGQAPAITSANSASFEVGQTVSFTVTTTGSPTPSLTVAGALPTGLTFVDNGNGTGTLSGTVAAGTVTTYNITFTAQNGVTPNAIQNFTLTITQAATMTSLMASPNPANSGQTVTLTANVTVLAPGSGSPTGTVTFSDNGAALSCTGGSQTLAAGQATCQYTFTAAGAHPLTAAYSGDANFTSSNGGTSLSITAPPPPPPVAIMDNETIHVTDTESFPDVFDAETVHVSDTAFITPLIQVYAPVAEFSAASLGFGSVPAGQTGMQFVTVSDIGQAPLVLSSAAISPGSPFSISQLACSNGAASLPTTLPVGGACTLMVSYTAPSSGPPPSATLTFTDNAALSNVTSMASGSSYLQSIALNGSGTTAPPPPPPPAVIPVMDNETITVTDTESFPDIFDAETVHVTDAVMITVLNTSAGANIVVTPADMTTGSTPVTMTFSNVTQPGNTTLATSSSGPPAPSSFQLGSPPVYYNLATTATYTGTITVCINYAGISFPYGTPSLWHYAGGGWVNITTSVNTSTMTVCGTTSSLSPFALFQPLILPPVANAGPAQTTVQCSGHSGTPVTLNGSASTDPQGEALTYQWTDSNGKVVGSSAVVTLNLPLGTFTFTLKVTNTSGLSSAAQTQVTVVDTIPPVLTLARKRITAILPAATAAGAMVNLTGIASATDTCDADPGITNNAPALFPIGKTEVTFTATDHSGNSTEKELEVHVIYHFEGYFPPLEDEDRDDRHRHEETEDHDNSRGHDGGEEWDTPSFHSGRTIPVRFQLRAANGTIVKDAVAGLEVFLVLETSSGPVLEPIQSVSSDGSSSGALFRFDPRSGEYIYELDTKGYVRGCYLLRTRINDSTRHDTHFSIRDDRK
jgi:predicted outer membrane repeat protein